jgi:dipeptidyl aminopeptidase/acylaminoacyl peptidase
MPDRSRRPRFALVLLALLVSALPLTADPGTRRPLTETDMFQFVWIADPQISPDGRQVVYTQVTVDAKKTGYDTALWIVPADGSAPARELTRGPQDANPRWSPDGTRLAFTRATVDKNEKDGKGQPPQLYLLSLVGGEPRALTDVPEGVGSPVWSPDGRMLAFTSDANDQDLAKQARQKAKDKEEKKEGADGKAAEEEHESDVRVITRPVYRMNGQGYLDPSRPSHLWTVEVTGDAETLPVAHQVTHGEFGEDNPDWSADGKLLYFRSTQSEALDEDEDNALWSVPVAGGEIRRVADLDGGINGFAVSPDGGRLAFVASPQPKTVRSYNQPDLFVAATNGGALRNLTEAFDFDVAGAITGDQKPPRGSQPQQSPLWSPDGRSLIITCAERGRANLQRIDAETGKMQPLTTGDQEVVSFSASRDGSRMALVISTPLVVGDLYAMDTATGKLRPLVRPNDALFSQIALSPPEEITYPSVDGRPIQAWVQKPVDFDPSKKYPLILEIHGGPHAAYGYTFDHEFQWLAARGYVVIYPNPRGSSSYGQEFGNVIQYHFPGDDAKDLVAGVDELIRHGYVDEKRLGVTGGSGGGILTNWIITHTDRFAAAVSQRSIADWSAFWYTADFILFRPTWFKAAPWEDPQDFAARSPITYVANIKTPLMLMEGEADWRTPSGAGGEQMFRALKYLKKPAVMVRFPGENHEVSRSGQPWHRIERLRHIDGWFGKYLQGKGGGEYRVE